MEIPLKMSLTERRRDVLNGALVIARNYYAQTGELEHAAACTDMLELIETIEELSQRRGAQP